MRARARPDSFTRASSRIVWTDSSRARSMKAQVLTTRQSAVSAASVISWPALESMPSISSESTWFLGQPRVVKWTFMTRLYDPTGRHGESTCGPRNKFERRRLHVYGTRHGRPAPIGAALHTGGLVSCARARDQQSRGRDPLG